MYVVDHHRVEELQRLIRQQTKAQILQRLQMAQLAKQGRSRCCGSGHCRGCCRRRLRARSVSEGISPLLFSSLESAQSANGRHRPTHYVPKL